MLSSAPRAEVDPDIMSLTAPGTTLAQHGLAFQTNQPTRYHLLLTARALSCQWRAGINRFIELHANEVKNDRQTDNKEQKHKASYRLRQRIATTGCVAFDSPVTQTNRPIEPLQVLTIMRNHDDCLPVFVQ